MQIALIGCGEVGGAYARALRDKVTLSLCDIEPGGRPGAVAEELGLQLHPAPGDWMRECDVVIAAVPGSECAVAAESALPFMGTGSIYIDVSTGAPDDIREWAGRFTAEGRGFADIAIMSAIALHGAAAPVLIASRDPERAKSVFAMMAASVRVLEGGAPGDAVALKLLRSVVIKGIECLAIESLTAAEHLGVRGRLLEILDDLDNTAIADYLEALVTTHLLHAGRRKHEMEDSTSQIQALGFDAAVTESLAKRYSATLEGLERNPPADDAHTSLDSALAWLIEIGRDEARS